MSPMLDRGFWGRAFKVWCQL